MWKVRVDFSWNFELKSVRLASWYFWFLDFLAVCKPHPITLPSTAFKDLANSHLIVIVLFSAWFPREFSIASAAEHAIRSFSCFDLTWTYTFHWGVQSLFSSIFNLKMFTEPELKRKRNGFNFAGHFWDESLVAGPSSSSVLQAIQAMSSPCFGL